MSIQLHVKQSHSIPGAAAATKKCVCGGGGSIIHEQMHGDLVLACCAQSLSLIITIMYSFTELAEKCQSHSNLGVV